MWDFNFSRCISPFRRTIRSPNYRESRVSAVFRQIKYNYIIHQHFGKPFFRSPHSSYYNAIRLLYACNTFSSAITFFSSRSSVILNLNFDNGGGCVPVVVSFFVHVACVYTFTYFFIGYRVEVTRDYSTLPIFTIIRLYSHIPTDGTRALFAGKRFFATSSTRKSYYGPQFARYLARPLVRKTRNSLKYRKYIFLTN